jgi:hypothetical protein
MIKIHPLRKWAGFPLIAALAIFTGAQLSGQCMPDTINCEDIGNPGQFCPLKLPHAGVNVFYDETVTVIPPGVFVIEGIQMTILHIRIDSVKNMPPGIDYAPNADIFYPDTAYCIQLNGTPTEVGVDTFSIYITAMVDIFGGLEYQVVDDSSIVLRVVEALGNDPKKMEEFNLRQNVPNPFSEFTRLPYYSPSEQRIELRVYSMLGVLVHRELEVATPGEHNFSFDGRKLEPGIYLYSVASEEAYFTGKFIKSR